MGFCIAFLVIAGAVYVLISVLGLVSTLALAVAASLLLAALLSPVVELLANRLRFPRSLAALIAVLLLLATIGLIATFFALGLTRELDNLRSDAATGLDDVEQWLVARGVSTEQIDRATAQLGERARALAPRLLSGAMNAVEFIGMSLLALVLLFFFLRDGRTMARFLTAGLSETNRDCALRASEAGWRALQAYVRGTAIIAAVDAVGIGIGLLVLRVPLAIPLTLITFIASFVPLVGATVAGALAVLVALAAKGPVTALLVLAVVLVVQNTEGNLLEPLIMGRAVQLHPAVILLAVAAGALVGGVGGALLATPLTAAVFRVSQVVRDCPGPRPEPAEP